MAIFEFEQLKSSASPLYFVTAKESDNVYKYTIAVNNKSELEKVANDALIELIDIEKKQKAQEAQ